MDPENKVWTLFSLLDMESPKVQKVSHWLSKKHKGFGLMLLDFCSISPVNPTNQPF